MAEGSLRDYFIRFLFKTDKDGIEKIKEGVAAIEKKLHNAGHEAFEFNEKLEKFKTTILEPLNKMREFVTQTAEEADNLRDLSERTGIATDTLEEYGYMAKLAGTSQETLTTGLRILEKNMGEAAAGGKEQAEAFGKLGISLHNANGKMKTTDELLPDISKAMEKLPNHAAKTALAMKLFGRSGQELLPLLEKGPEEIKAMREELAALGGVTSEEFLDASEKYVDNLEKMNQVWKGIRQAITGPLIQVINRASDAFLTWIKANGALMRSRITEWMQQLVNSFESFLHMIQRIATPLLIMAAALNIPFLTMVGIRAILVLIVDELDNWMDGNDSVIGRVIANWDEWLMELEKTSPKLAAIAAAFEEMITTINKRMKEHGGFGGMVLNQLDGVLAMFKVFADELEDILLAPFRKMQQGFSNAFSFIRTSLKAAGFDGAAAAAGRAGEGVNDEFMDDAERRRRRRNKIAGASSQPAAVSSMSSSENMSSVQAPMTFNITAGAGVDGRALSSQIGDVVHKEVQSLVRQSYMSIVPEAF